MHHSMKKILHYGTFLMLLSLSIGVFAQDRTVSGKVTSSDDGTALPGVNVVVKGTSNGATTDSNGEYRLNLTGTQTILVFSFIGYKTSEISVGDRTVINLSLESDIRQLSEVVVVGYGEQKREDLTGSIATVKSQQVENRPFSSVDKILQGQIAGLQSVASSGQPGAAQAILIRGGKFSNS